MLAAVKQKKKTADVHVLQPDRMTAHPANYSVVHNKPGPAERRIALYPPPASSRGVRGIKGFDAFGAVRLRQVPCPRSPSSAETVKGGTSVFYFFLSAFLGPSLVCIGSRISYGPSSGFDIGWAEIVVVGLDVCPQFTWVYTSVKTARHFWYVWRGRWNRDSGGIGCQSRESNTAAKKIFRLSLQL